MIKKIDFILPSRLQKRFRLSKDVRTIVKSGLFSSSHYHSQNSEIKYCQKSLIQHYLLYGAWEHKNPNPFFDSAYYLDSNHDVFLSGINPLLHYIQKGWREGRDPHPGFNTTRYLNSYPDVKNRKINPLFHYLKYGKSDGLNPCPPPKMPINKFQDFTYSKRSHWELFAGLDKEWYDKIVETHNCTLKEYQDLMVLTFINDYVPPGSRILDIGGGDSRILKHCSGTYDCWNIDKMEGLGNGPVVVNQAGYKLVKDYMGQFNPELPDNSFDFVFSISALEHTPDDQNIYDNIIKDIDRVLKPDGYSLHLFDVVLRGNGKMWSNKFVHRIFDTVDTVNQLVTPEMVCNDDDLFCMSETAYNKNWKHITKRDYKEFGKPLSLNILWQK